MLPTFQRRRGRSQNNRYIKLSCTPDRQIPCRITQAFLLLVGRIVFFIHDNQAQPGSWCQHGHTCSQNDTRPASQDRQPVPQPFRFRQTAVQCHDAFLRETLPDRLFQLGRQVDLGNHDQYLRICFSPQKRLDRMQIDFRLAAAGHAIKDIRRKPVGMHDGVNRLLLCRMQLRPDRTFP